ncbi:MAG: S24 family peptidase, partial [Cetobacterium sp.]
MNDTQRPLQHVQTHYACSPSSFAVRLTDRSNAPEYDEGHTVVIDPDAVVQPGHMVLAVKDGTSPAMLRRLKVQAEGRFLEPLNGNWPTDRLDE